MSYIEKVLRPIVMLSPIFPDKEYDVSGAVRVVSAGNSVIQVLAKEGDIPGAYRTGKKWILPGRGLIALVEKHKKIQDEKNLARINRNAEKKQKMLNQKIQERQLALPGNDDVPRLMLEVLERLSELEKAVRRHETVFAALA